eukprot:scaffold17687_cov90-Phaeocystis_antarctica.AAC.1
MSAATPRPRPWLPRLPCWRRPRLSLRPKWRPTGLHLDADLRCVAINPRQLLKVQSPIFPYMLLRSAVSQLGWDKGDHIT